MKKGVIRKSMYLFLLLVGTQVNAQYYSNYRTSADIVGTTSNLISLSRDLKRQKAEEKYSEALSCLTGFGAVIDTTKAIRLMKESAKGGSVKASLWLGKEYFYEGGALNKNFKEAEKWFEKNSSLMDLNEECELYLGLLYYDDTKLGYNFKKAEKHFKRTAGSWGRDLSKEGYYYLGMLYLKEGKKTDEATDYIAKSASGGYPMAMYGLGILYLEGKYISKNRNEAERWLWNASREGVAEAKEVLRKEFGK